MRREDCCQDLDSRQGLFELTHSAGQSPVRPGYPGDSDEPASLEGTPFHPLKWGQVLTWGFEIACIRERG